MHFQLSCKQCGQLLFEAEEIMHYEDWYSHMYSSVNGQCPKCGHKLPDPCSYGHDLTVDVLIMKDGRLEKVEVGPEW